MGASAGGGPSVGQGVGVGDGTLSVPRAGVGETEAASEAEARSASRRAIKFQATTQPIRLKVTTLMRRPWPVRGAGGRGGR
jgi:hypothetical protein